VVDVHLTEPACRARILEVRDHHCVRGIGQSVLCEEQHRRVTALRSVVIDIDACAARAVKCDAIDTAVAPLVTPEFEANIRQRRFKSDNALIVVCEQEQSIALESIGSRDWDPGFPIVRDICE